MGFLGIKPTGTATGLLALFSHECDSNFLGILLSGKQCKDGSNISVKNAGGYVGELTNSQRNTERQMMSIFIDSDEASVHRFNI